MSTFIEQGTRRLMDVAYLRGPDGIVYTSEQLAIALLLRSKMKRSTDNEKYVAGMLDDPNIKK